jgi:DNA-binding response OmpR family regulator
LIVVEQCAVLFVNVERTSAHAEALRDAGFVVSHVNEWPEDEAAVRKVHALVVRVHDGTAAPMLAARLRAKPHVGRKALVALVDPATTPDERRNALASGFDDVIDESCESRRLVSRMLRVLQTRPELGCALPPRTKRPAA